MIRTINNYYLRVQRSPNGLSGVFCEVRTQSLYVTFLNFCLRGASFVWHLYSVVWFKHACCHFISMSQAESALLLRLFSFSSPQFQLSVGLQNVAIDSPSLPLSPVRRPSNVASDQNNLFWLRGGLPKGVRGWAVGISRLVAILFNLPFLDNSPPAPSGPYRVYAPLGVQWWFGVGTIHKQKLGGKAKTVVGSGGWR